jgi:hypothetical protein
MQYALTVSDTKYRLDSANKLEPRHPLYLFSKKAGIIMLELRGNARMFGDTVLVVLPIAAMSRT